jgi:hypothetical protein
MAGRKGGEKSETAANSEFRILNSETAEAGVVGKMGSRGVAEGAEIVWSAPSFRAAD